MNCRGDSVWECLWILTHPSKICPVLLSNKYVALFKGPVYDLHERPIGPTVAKQSITNLDHLGDANGSDI